MEPRFSTAKNNRFKIFSKSKRPVSADYFAMIDESEGYADYKSYEGYKSYADCDFPKRKGLNSDSATIPRSRLLL